MSSDHHLARLAEEAYERLGDNDEALWFEGRWRSSADLRDLAHRVGGGLHHVVGVAPGDRVVVFLPNLPEVGVLYTAIWRAGAVATPVIFLLPAEQLRHVLQDAGAVAVVTSPEFLGVVQQATAGLDGIRIVLIGDPVDGTVPFVELASAEPTGITDRDDRDLAALLYTGGTTGRSKGVMITHEGLWSSGRSAQDAGYVEGVTSTITALPLAHVFGLMITVAGMHAYEPNRTVLLRWFDPALFLDGIERFRMQRATVVPSMLRLLLAQPLEDRDLSSWRFANCGSAPLPLEVAREFERRVPSVEILEGYGMTETAGLLTANPPDARKLGTVGVAAPGYEIAVVDDEDRPVGPGTPGEIVARGAGVMAGYWQADEATEDAIRDGWLHTGDIGALDDDGYLTILDRKKDLIIRGGFNVYPSDVEDALVAHPAVALAAVVGRADETYGEEVVAFVQLVPGAEVSADELVIWGREHIGGYKYPREVQVVEQVPLTPVMKVDRKAVRALL